MAFLHLLGVPNTAVRLFETAANQRTAWFGRIQFGFVAATSIELLMKVILFFYPTHHTLVSILFANTNSIETGKQL